jgi:hypothetical protein
MKTRKELTAEVDNSLLTANGLTAQVVIFCLLSAGVRVNPRLAFSLLPRMI